MMMLALLLMAADPSPARDATFPPAPSGKQLRPGAVEIVNPIAPAVARYSNCLRREMQARGALPMMKPSTHRRDADASIKACAEVRASTVTDAEAALAKAPGYGDPTRRKGAIAHAFKGTEYQQREMVAIMDAIRRERSK